MQVTHVRIDCGSCFTADAFERASPNHAIEHCRTPYHLGMMAALLLYVYKLELYSAHQLARSFNQRVDVTAVTGLDRLDFHTVADFRKRHLVALSDLFVQVLRLYRAAGLVQCTPTVKAAVVLPTGYQAAICRG